MKKIIAVVIISFLANWSFSQNKDGRPNVILIYSDDQGYADLGIYGSEDLETPHLDKLAKSGSYIHHVLLRLYPILRVL